jgi:hypothetical protein
MADALKTFREGEDILASETNGNNQYLLSRLSDNAAQVQNYVESEVATIKSNVASVQATLQGNIDETMNQLSMGGLFITLTVNNGNWSKEYYSDKSRTIRVWMEQGGVTGAFSDYTLVFPRAFQNANYSFVAMPTSTGGNNALTGVYASDKTTTSIVLHGRSTNDIGFGYGVNSVSWYACGA